MTLKKVMMGIWDLFKKFPTAFVATVQIIICILSVITHDRTLSIISSCLVFVNLGIMAFITIRMFRTRRQQMRQHEEEMQRMIDDMYTRAGITPPRR